VKIRIYYEDTDAGGIVYHTNYLKYCERARSELFFSAGVVPFEGDRSGFVVKSIVADFIGSAKLGDIIEVKSGILVLKRASLSLRQQIFKDSRLIFSADITLAFIKESRPSKIPQKFLALFSQLDSF